MTMPSPWGIDPDWDDYAARGDELRDRRDSE